MNTPTDFSSLCDSWSQYLRKEYAIDLDTESVGAILTRLGAGTRVDYDVTMRYISSRERDDSVTHHSMLSKLQSDHVDCRLSIQQSAKRDRRALEDRRKRLSNKLRLQLSQCDTVLEKSAAYAAMDSEVDELRDLLSSVDDAELLQLSDETRRYQSAVEQEELRYSCLLARWRMWRDATDRIFASGLVLPPGAMRYTCCGDSLPMALDSALTLLAGAEGE